MAGFVAPLRPGAPIEPVVTFAGPWRRIAVEVLGSDAELRWDATASEHAVFIVTGTARLSGEGLDEHLEAGDALTLGRGADVVLRSGGAGAEVFVATLDA